MRCREAAEIEYAKRSLNDADLHISLFRSILWETKGMYNAEDVNSILISIEEVLEQKREIEKKLEVIRRKFEP